MCAMLAKGWSLTDAVRIANAAASLAIRNSDYGVPVSPQLPGDHGAAGSAMTHGPTRQP